MTVPQDFVFPLDQLSLRSFLLKYRLLVHRWWAAVTLHRCWSHNNFDQAQCSCSWRPKDPLKTTRPPISRFCKNLPKTMIAMRQSRVPSSLHRKFQSSSAPEVLTQAQRRENHPVRTAVSVSLSSSYLSWVAIGIVVRDRISVWDGAGHKTS